MIRTIILAIAGVAAVVSFLRSGGDAQTGTDYPPPERLHDGIGRGVITVDTYGCPTKAEAERIRRFPKRIQSSIYGDKYCVHFKKGDRVIVDQGFPLEKMYLARRPGDLAPLWFYVEGVIEPEKRP